MLRLAALWKKVQDNRNGILACTLLRYGGDRSSAAPEYMAGVFLESKQPVDVAGEERRYVDIPGSDREMFLDACGVLPEYMSIAGAQSEEHGRFRGVIQQLGKEHALIGHQGAGIVTERRRVSWRGWPGQVAMPEQLAIGGSQRVYLLLPFDVDHLVLHGDRWEHSEYQPLTDHVAPEVLAIAGTIRHDGGWARERFRVIREADQDVLRFA